ncbi:hypothetical protein EIP91_005011 [Steccherinum ochraceum]|uniref:Protein kinase domain-containing protein n=1 Tax=Steccherinum ochraceum TaxID=92696 RepID=A0A4R0RAD6_9APHY|nr:hypothetical protein EIP91_005011 [Steccherinum ochraceum]
MAPAVARASNDSESARRYSSVIIKRLLATLAVTDSSPSGLYAGATLLQPGGRMKEIYAAISSITEELRVICDSLTPEWFKPIGSLPRMKEMWLELEKSIRDTLAQSLEVAKIIHVDVKDVLAEFEHCNSAISKATAAIYDGNVISNILECYRSSSLNAIKSVCSQIKKQVRAGINLVDELQRLTERASKFELLLLRADTTVTSEARKFSSGAASLSLPLLSITESWKYIIDTLESETLTSAFTLDGNDLAVRLISLVRLIPCFDAFKQPHLLSYDTCSTLELLLQATDSYLQILSTAQQYLVEVTAKTTALKNMQPGPLSDLFRDAFVLLPINTQLSERILHFSGTDSISDAASAVLEILQEVLDAHDSPAKTVHYHQARRLLVRSGSELDKMPSSYMATGVQLYPNNSVSTQQRHGYWATVLKARWNNGDVALKKFIRTHLRSGEDAQRPYSEFVHEVIIWRQLKHPNIQAFLAVTEEHTTAMFGGICVLSHWAENGDLHELIARDTMSSAELEVFRPRWIADIARGLGYLAQERIVHGDLKGRNVLIDSHMRARLTDFGITKLADSNVNTNGPDYAMSIYWAAPELRAQSRAQTRVKPTLRSDLYSFGVTCVEEPQIYNDFFPDSLQLSDEAMWLKMSRDDWPPEPVPDSDKPSTKSASMPSELWDLVQKCCQTAPENRPGPLSLVQQVEHFVVSGVLPGFAEDEGELSTRLQELWGRSEYTRFRAFVLDVYRLHCTRDHMKEIVGEVIAKRPDSINLGSERAVANLILGQVMDVLHEALGDETLESSPRRDSLNLLLSAAQYFQLLPSCFYLEDVRTERPVYSLPKGPLGSKVFQGRWNEKAVLIKVPRTSHADNVAHTGSLFRSIALWRVLKHENIHQILGVTVRDDPDARVPRVVFAMEVSGNLTGAFHTFAKALLDSRRPSWIWGIAQGLQFLHSLFIVHGNLRGETILVDEANNVQLSDYGVALPDVPYSTVEALPDTPRAANIAWEAPEMSYDSKAADFMTDVYIPVRHPLAEPPTP